MKLTKEDPIFTPLSLLIENEIDYKDLVTALRAVTHNDAFNLPARARFKRILRLLVNKK